MNKYTRLHCSTDKFFDYTVSETFYDYVPHLFFAGLIGALLAAFLILFVVYVI